MSIQWRSNPGPVITETPSAPAETNAPTISSYSFPSTIDSQNTTYPSNTITFSDESAISNVVFSFESLFWWPAGSGSFSNISIDRLVVTYDITTPSSEDVILKVIVEDEHGNTSENYTIESFTLF